MNPIFLFLKKIILAGVLTSLVGGAALFFPNAAVQASALPQTVTPPSVQTPVPQNAQDGKVLRTARLERLYQRELRLLEAQGRRLNRVDQLTARAGQLIGKLKEKGIDTQVLETALGSFEASIPAAVSAHDQAKSILVAHAGFDFAGKVTDAPAARETVKNAGDALKGAHTVIKDAFRDLLKTLRQYKQQNRNPKPTASPAPAF